MDNSLIKLSNIKVIDGETKSSWLRSSTYVPEKLIDYYPTEEIKNEINYNAILESDSGEDLSHFKLHKKRKEKRKHHKKTNKRKIVKHFLNGIETIDDENCKYRKMIFVEEVPREERIEAFFVDRRGNPYISQYGSICEKHIPKYRLQRKVSLSTAISDRYYITMKNLKTEKGQSSIVKKDCDSHCTCHQFFIPVPYDIVTTVPQDNLYKEQEMLKEVTIINETINKDLHNIDAWLCLVNIQSKANEMGVSSSQATSIVVEKRLMIVERALTKNQSNLQLHLLRMSLGGDVWPLYKLQKEWNQLLFVWNTNINVWKFYIDQIAKKSLGFSVDKIISIYNKCFSTFFNVMSGRMKTKTIDCDTVMDLCDFFADYCDYLSHSGYQERALASWQAVIEYNLFCGQEVPKQSGNILDDPMLRSFQDYWTWCPQHIGQPDCNGWRGSEPNGMNHCPLQASLEHVVSKRESELIAGELVEHEMWLSLEETRSSAWWLPYTAENTEQEDPDRLVPFPLVQASLVTVHGPCNLEDGPLSASEVSVRAKQRLALLFLDWLGVSDPRVSIKHQLSSVTIIRQQLALCGPTRPYTEAVSQGRHSQSLVAAKCLDRVGLLFDDDWRDDMAVLALSSKLSGHRWSVDTAWKKETLAAVRLAARTILGRSGISSEVWLAYAESLVALAVHGPWREEIRAVRSLAAEATKVVRALTGQSVTNVDIRLSCLYLSLSLTAMSDSESISDTLTQTLHQATLVLADHHSLHPPAQQSLSSLCLHLSEVAHIIANQDTLTNHWHWTLYMLALATLLLVDVQPFLSWMSSEFLTMVTTIGTAHNWCPAFNYQLSDLLEHISTFFAWRLRGRDLNESAHLQSMLTPIMKTLAEIQSSPGKYETSITDTVFSPHLIQLSVTGPRSVARCQTLAVRNFLWTLMSASESETTTEYNNVCHGSSLLLVDLELSRWRSVADNGDMEGFSGRSDRVRSTFNRLLALRCMYWRHRLALWLSLMKFESDQSQNEEKTKGVFYRAVTEMPGQKSLYIAIVRLVPSILEEAVTLMKNNGVRVCAPLEEIRLLMRIRESSRQSVTESMDAEVSQS